MKIEFSIVGCPVVDMSTVQNWRNFNFYSFSVVENWRECNCSKFGIEFPTVENSTVQKWAFENSRKKARYFNQN